MPSSPGETPRTPTIDRKATRRAFSRAACNYASAAVLAHEIGVRQLERLSLTRVQPERILDLGCGPGTHTAALSRRYPKAQLVALDASREMLIQLQDAPDPHAISGVFGGTIGRTLERTFSSLKRRIAPAHGRDAKPIMRIQADFERLPFSTESFDFIWSNFALAHALDLPRALRALATVTRTGGLVMLTVPGPDTLCELRRALAQLGLPDTTHPFPDMHDVGDMLMGAGFADPVVDTERITLEYMTPERLWGDLRALGAVTARMDRPRGLTTHQRLRRIETALRNAHDSTASVTASLISAPMRLTVEVVYAHAWKVAPRTTEDGRAIVHLHRERPNPSRRSNGDSRATNAD